MEIVYESVVITEDYYIIVLSDENGIIGNTIPVNSINIAYESIKQIKLQLTKIGYKIIETKADPVNNNFGKIIYGLHSNPKAYWNKSLDLMMLCLHVFFHHTQKPHKLHLKSRIYLLEVIFQIF